MGIDPCRLMKIKILAWNVRGLNDREKRRMINSVIRAQKADLVCCLETKVSEMSLKLVKSLGAGRFTDWGAVDARGCLLEGSRIGGQLMLEVPQEAS